MGCCKEESLGRVIYFVAQDMRNFAEKILKPFDLTLEQFHLMKNMPIGEGLNQRQICEIASKTPANMTRILDRLESKGLVVRRENPEDRRAALVFFTDRGQKLLAEVMGVFESFSSEFTQGISVEERQAVRAVLDRISANIKKMSEELEERSA